jgi:hypothetical protein
MLAILPWACNLKEYSSFGEIISTNNLTYEEHHKKHLGLIKIVHFMLFQNDIPRTSWDGTPTNPLENPNPKYSF